MAKLRELESWYVDAHPDSREFLYSQAFVAAHGWDCNRSGIYLTAKKSGYGRVRLQPGLRTKEIESSSEIENCKLDGYDGVTYKGRDGNMRMILFDCRNVTKPVGPERAAAKSKTDRG